MMGWAVRDGKGGMEESDGMGGMGRKGWNGKDGIGGM